MFCPSCIERVVVKLPFCAGVTTSSLVLVEMIMMASLAVFPDTVTVFLSVTSSSIGVRIVRTVLALGVGVGGFMDVIFFGGVWEIVLVLW